MVAVGPSAHEIIAHDEPDFEIPGTSANRAATSAAARAPMPSASMAK
jgi:hypothetical protein